MNYNQQRQLKRYVPLVLLTFTIYLFYTLYLSSEPRSIGSIPFKDHLPLITLIGIFEGPKLSPEFFPYFLQSVGRQAHALDLVIIQRRGCEDISGWTKGMSNIKHVCLSEEKFWGLHSDYFCKKWGGCTKAQKKILHGDMISFGRVKKPQSQYPIIRGWVFKKYIRPETAYWGFLDFDTMLGDFSQMFPYDRIKHPYDIIMPTTPNDEGGPRLIFMKGHMTFIRNSPETEKKLLGYPDFRNFTEWDEGGLDGYPSAIEESSYSSYVGREPSIDILTFDGLAPAPYIRSSSQAGILTLPDTLRPKSGSSAPLSLSPHLIQALSIPALGLPSSPSFTSEGIERSIRVISGHKPKDINPWFEEIYTNYYIAESVPKDRFHNIGGGKRIKWKRYLMKKNGKWLERLEPMKEFNGHGNQQVLNGAYQWLYVHWQEEKRQAHFREFPQNEIGDIFINYFYDGNAAYNSKSGQRVAWVPRRPESCSSMGCVEPDEVSILDGAEFKKWDSERLDMEDWWVLSKRIRLGYSTATLPPAPARPTTPVYTRLVKGQ